MPICADGRDSGPVVTRRKRCYQRDPSRPLASSSSAAARRAIGAGARPVKQALENAGHMPQSAPRGAADSGGAPPENAAEVKLRAVLEFLSGKASDARAPGRAHPERAASVEACMPILARYAAQWPGYGHRRLHRLMLADGHVTSESTVFRALRLLRAQNAAPGPAADPKPGQGDLTH